MVEYDDFWQSYKSARCCYIDSQPENVFDNILKIKAFSQDPLVFFTSLNSELDCFVLVGRRNQQQNIPCVTPKHFFPQLVTKTSNMLMKNA